jgi:hypothetical protein
VKEANNIYCYNNYFENAGVGGSSEAVSYNFVSPNLKNINFLFNTFVNCGDIDLGSGATNNTWANNIFKKSGTIFSGSPSGISWAGNIYQGTLGMSIPTGMKAADPLLELNSDGYYGLSSLSPAVNAASASFPPILDILNIDDDPSMLLDISGQQRSVTMNEKDVGCDEYQGTGNSMNRPLKVSDVGPSYLGGPISELRDGSEINSLTATPLGFKLSDAFPNPFNPSTTIQFQLLSAGEVSLKIYDQLGREISTLINGVQQAGKNQIEWDAASYSSGVYFCRLMMGEHFEMKKLFLIK